MKTLGHVLLAAGTSILVALLLETLRADAAKQPIAQGPAPGYDHV